MQPVFHRKTCSPAGQAGAQPACTAGSDDVKVMHSSPAVALPTQPCAKRWGAPRASLVSQEEALVAADGLVVVDGCTNSILVAVPHQLGHLGLCQPILLLALQGASTVFTKSSDHEGKRQLADMSSDPLLRCLQVGSSNLELYQPCKFGAGLWGERAYDNDNFVSLSMKHGNANVYLSANRLQTQSLHQERPLHRSLTLLTVLHNCIIMQLCLRW